MLEETEINQIGQFSRFARPNFGYICQAVHRFWIKTKRTTKKGSSLDLIVKVHTFRSYFIVSEAILNVKEPTVAKAPYSDILHRPILMGFDRVLMVFRRGLIGFVHRSHVLSEKSNIYTNYF